MTCEVPQYKAASLLFTNSPILEENDFDQLFCLFAIMGQTDSHLDGK